MKNLVLPALLAICFAFYSCGSSKNTMQTGSDKNISSLLKKLNRNPDDMQVQSDLKYVYAQSVKEHEDKISAYKANTSTDRWDIIMRKENTFWSWKGGTIAARPTSHFRSPLTMSQDSRTPLVKCRWLITSA